MFHSLKDCRAQLKFYKKKLAEIPQARALSSEQESFLLAASQFLGKRVLRYDKSETPNLEITPKKLVIKAFDENDLDLHIQWTSTPQTTPSVTYETNRNVLTLPQGYNPTKSNQGAFEQAMKVFLQGHDLHPYINTESSRSENVQLGESSFRLKPNQKMAHNAYLAVKKEKKRKFLLVAHTGAGKTENLLLMLKDRMKEGFQKGKKLHIITAEQGVLTNQLHKRLNDLKSSAQEDFEILFWESIDGNPVNMDLLKKTVRESKKPIVLVTTASGLRIGSGTKTMGRAYKENIRFFAENTFSLAHDEANFSGGPVIKKVIDDIFHAPHSEVFFYGMAATPIRGDDLRVSEDLFDGASFYAGVDDLKSFQSRLRGEHPNTLMSIYHQLRNAIWNGEAAPVKLMPIDPEKFDQGKDDFYQKSGPYRNSLFMVNPKYYQALIESTRPIYEKHKKVLVTANTVDEAELYYRALQKAYPDKKVGVTYQKGTPKLYQKKMRDNFQKGSDDEDSIDIMVAVRQMDFGIDIPELGAVHILGKNVSTSTWLQRLGRILRLNKNKREVDIIAPFSKHSSDLTDQLILLDIARDSLFRRVPRGKHDRKNLEEYEGEDLSFFGCLTCPQRYVDNLNSMAKERRALIETKLFGSAESFAKRFERTAKKLEKGEAITLRWLEENDLAEAYQYHIAQNRNEFLDFLKSEKIIEFSLNAQKADFSKQKIFNIERDIDLEFDPKKGSLESFLGIKKHRHAISYLVRHRPLELLAEIKNPVLKKYIHKRLMRVNEAYNTAKSLERLYRKTPPPNGTVTYKWVFDNGLYYLTHKSVTSQKELVLAALETPEIKKYVDEMIPKGDLFENLAKEIEDRLVETKQTLSPQWLADHQFTHRLSRYALKDKETLLEKFSNPETRKYVDTHYGRVKRGQATPNLARDLEEAFKKTPPKDGVVTREWLEEHNLYERSVKIIKNNKEELLRNIKTLELLEYVKNRKKIFKSIRTLAADLEAALKKQPDLSLNLEWLEEKGYHKKLIHFAQSNQDNFQAAFTVPSIKSYMKTHYSLEALKRP